MRLVAWNCCEGLASKYAALAALDFDVAVVTEGGPFDPGLGDGRELSVAMHRPVADSGHRKHIVVLAQSPWKVTSLPLIEDQPWVLPVRISGPCEFTLMALWALGPEWTTERLSYTAQTARTVSALVDYPGGVVVAGDFNAPLHSDASAARRHDANVAALAERGLVSAFSASRAQVDPLSAPTHYCQRKVSRPFHIDHVFVPQSWTDGINVEVGTHADWVATGRSDHVPVQVDVPSLSAAI